MAYENLKPDDSACYPNLPPPSPDASAPPLPSGTPYAPPQEQEYPAHPLFPTSPSPLFFVSSPVHVYAPPPVYPAQLHQVDGYPRPQGPFIVPPPAVIYPERNGMKDRERKDRHRKPKRGCCCGFWRGCCSVLCCCCLLDLCCPSICCF
ncbi:hypothetical protein MLD38_019186 [Melastoma candidum]|uniref:Uncharacterized protein n=1 Tax=Melastoma candidum TaxID=119954 RepID=A0ACB9QWD4_9MYRT|nr:hypothetical protein MLD38_019186 [Melastoma candidum]